MPLIKTAICVLLLQLYFVGFSQYRFEKAVALNADNGLPSNDIRRITKGPDGFIWIATSGGLCRYDGSRVKTYRHIPGKNSLKNNSVLDVLPLEREIWAAHEEGISILDLSSQKFRHYQFPDGLVAKDNFEESGAVSRLMKDTEGNIWLATRRLGIWYYDAGNSVFKTFTPKNEKYKNEPFLGDINGVLSIEQSRTDKNIIWAGTSAGLLIVNKNTGRIKWQPFITGDKKLQVAANAFRRLYHHNDGLVYVGTWSAGVQVFDPTTNELKPLPHKDETANYILKSTVSSIIPKNEHSIWITCGRGLLLYDTQQQEILFSKINSQVDNQFYGVQFIDERQRIWNYNVDGIKYFDPVVQQVDIYSYAELFGKDWAFTFHIASAGKDSLIVCPANSDGLYLFNRPKRTWKHLPFLKEGNPIRTVVHGFVKTKKGDMYLTTNQGFFRYHPSSKKLEQVHIPIALKYYRWNQLLMDLDDNLWLSAEGEGLVYWNRSKNKAKLFPQSGVESFHNRRNLFCDSRNNIWFTSSRQVGVYVRDKNQILIFKADERLSIPYVTGFAEDKQKRIWASNRKGLFAYAHAGNPEAGFQPQFYMKDKGLEDYAFRITSDTRGKIWGYNRNKLFAIMDSTGNLDSYPFQYGIRVADFYHFSSLPSGELIFGGRSNIILADPYTFKSNTEVPQPYIASLEVLENTNKAITSNASTLELKYREKNISLSFSAIAYSMPDQLKFRYRLRGLHDWVESDERRSVIYTNLKGGNYLFQVEVSNSQGQWIKAMAELPIKILSPWWQSTWFIVSAIILFLAALYIIYKSRVNSIRKKAKLKTEYEKRIANVELSALLAQMNPHFLFNSLNSIDSYIIRNEPKKASEYLNNFARLIRLILQNSKSNFISLKDELETLDLYLQMESLRFKNKFSYSIRVDKNIEPEKLQIPPLLIQPYVENAIWHGIMNMSYDFKGQVQIHISRHENMLICTVEDNGIGRQKAMELNSQRQGLKRKSMGMQITKDRIDMINKLHNKLTTVEIIDMKDEEQNAKGTKVQLIIPIN